MRTEDTFTEMVRGAKRYGRSHMINVGERPFIEWCVTASSEADRDAAYHLVVANREEYDLLTPGITHLIELGVHGFEFDFYRAI